MTVDLSKAKAGDTVKFRCGGKAIVESYENDKSSLPHGFTFEGEGFGTRWFYPDGSENRGDSDLLDIIAIEPGPFDWETVKPGMAFRHDLGGGNDDIRYFIGGHLKDNSLVFCTWNRSFSQCGQFAKSYLTRAPEHDISVTE